MSIVLVKCRECAGTGLARGGIYQCGECLGQCHVAVDCTKDGGIPDGWQAWHGPAMGPIRDNPLRLTYASP